MCGKGTREDVIARAKPPELRTGALDKHAEACGERTDRTS